MINKEEYFKIIKTSFKNKKLIKIFENQIEMYYDYNENNNNIFKIGDTINLNKNYLIHGTKSSVEELINFSNTGIIASEFYFGMDVTKKKPWVAEFWKIDENISLGNFIKKYCGFTIEFKESKDKIIKTIICSFDSLKKEIIEMQNYRDYIIYQNQEQRFLPNEFNKNSTVAFIINCNTKLKEELIKNDIFSDNFDRKLLKNILPKWFIKKYIEGDFDNYETGREKAILFGIPPKMIEGIMVNEDIEKNNKLIHKIKTTFPNCYICNIEGIVIK